MTFLVLWTTVSTTLIEKIMSMSLSGIGNIVLRFDQSKYIRITPAPLPPLTTSLNSSSVILNNTINSKSSIDVEIGIIRIDSIYIITIFFILVGLLWLSLTTKLFAKLKNVSLNEWQIKNE